MSGVPKMPVGFAKPPQVIVVQVYRPRGTR